MTEAEWLASDDPAAMLGALTGRRFTGVCRQPDAPGNRELRLFACACCRQVWNLLTDERSRNAVEVAERYANGEATKSELLHAYDAALKAFSEPGPQFNSFSAELAMRLCVRDIKALSENTGLPRWFSVSTKLAEAQAALLRDIVGNPFRPVELPPGPCPDCGNEDTTTPHRPGPCPWLTPVVLSLAGDIYESRRWDLMPILADALEDACCDNKDILRHCRGQERCFCCEVAMPRGTLALSGVSVRVRVGETTSDWFLPQCRHCLGSGWRPLRGPHVRGCWALDLMLGKE